MANTDFDKIFSSLKAILQTYEDELVVVKDEAKNYYLDSKYTAPNKKPMFFGAVKTMSKTVNYYLMPVYTNPELLEGMSPQLRKRMQGKSCFNFKNIDEDLFAELAQLTKAGLEEFHKTYSE